MEQFDRFALWPLKGVSAHDAAESAALRDASNLVEDLVVAEILEDKIFLDASGQVAIAEEKAPK